jgi:hypothetical protein
MLQTPLKGGVVRARVSGVVSLLSLLISFVVLEDLQSNSKELQQRHLDLHWRRELQ